MSIIDSQTLFSDNQVIAASGADVVSTNILDLAPHLAANAAYSADTFVGDDFEIEALITAAVTGGTSIQPVLQTDTNTNFSTAMLEFPMSAPIPVAQAIPGKKIIFSTPGNGCKRYLRVVWRNVGANVSGTGSAYVVLDSQNNVVQSAGGFFVG